MATYAATGEAARLIAQGKLGALLGAALKKRAAARPAKAKEAPPAQGVKKAPAKTPRVIRVSLAPGLDPDTVRQRALRELQALPDDYASQDKAAGLRHVVKTGRSMAETATATLAYFGGIRPKR
ncbi:MAG TPA: hypothetical protein PLJ35_21820 [Anaerolineae bacterium]|nr:hypothetical protein [Anaerolineae bacterium]